MRLPLRPRNEPLAARNPLRRSGEYVPTPGGTGHAKWVEWK